METGLLPSLGCFNSRVRGGRDDAYKRQAQAERVSTHASAGDATKVREKMQRHKKFQLTRPRGTRHDKIDRAPRIVAVSTHASAGDATELHSGLVSVLAFQLTRPRGTRPRRRADCSPSAEFQLTRPRGTRRPSRRNCLWCAVVSTHASAGDATKQELKLELAKLVSTHASAGDATQPLSMQLVNNLFQLTRPRGTRPLNAGDLALARGFNSRVRGGRDA